MSLPGVLNLVGNRWGVYRGDTWGPKRIQLTRVVRDANGSAASAIVTSATAVFTDNDIGVRVVPLLADGKVDTTFGTLTILSRQSATQVTLNAPLPFALSNRLLMIMRRDVTGHTFTSQVRQGVEAVDPVAVITCTTVSAVMGVVDLSMSATITAAIATAGSSYAWDLQSTASGVVKTWLKGSVSVDADVTRT